MKPFSLSFSASFTVVRRLPADYLSFTLDTSLVLGGRWWGASRQMRRGVAVDTVTPLDLEQERLSFFAKALAPAMLRIGGTEADRVRYQMKKKTPPAETHEYSMNKARWKLLNRFARKNGLQILFTLSAGPADRDAAGGWLDGNARELIAHSVRKGFLVSAWELGNEVNGFPFIHGWPHRVSPLQYSADFQRLGLLLEELDPRAIAVGPSSAVWPVIGEPNPILTGLCRGKASPWLGAVSWHYYPQQSTHGPIATRRVGKKTMLQARNLDGVLRWTRMVRRALKLTRHPGVENWMTETAHALYGGEPGLSDTFASTLWWLDELGLLAREGVDKVFRQALVGARYGLLDEKTLTPRPDYWASFLWKKLMGEVVYPSPLSSRAPRKARAYLHGREGEPGVRTLLLVNVSEKRSFSLVVPGTLRRVYCLQGQTGLCSPVATLNGVPLDDDLIAAWGRKRTARKYHLTATGDRFVAPPLSCSFVELELT